MKKFLMMSVSAGALMFSIGLALAAGQEPTQQSERIYGSQLMTQQERAEHRSKMRSAKTAEERQLIRAEHHERMKERAKQRGVTLPDEPPVGGGMMAPIGGMGGGMGQGVGGMQSGGGRNR